MDLQGITLVVAVLFLVLVWLATSLRFYVRVRMLNSFGMDDWFMLVTLVLFSVLVPFIIVTIRFDPNGDPSTLPVAEMNSIKFQILTEVVYTATACVLKVSIALLLRRITQDKLYIYILHGSIGFICLYTVVCLFLTLFQCQPVSFAWDPSGGEGSCMSPKQRTGIAYALSALAIATDWFYATLPIFIIRELKMNWWLRFYINMVLGVGALACIATIVRLVYIIQLEQFNTQVNEKGLIAPAPNVYIWTIVEIGFGILAACVATLKPLMQYFKFAGLSHSSGNTTVRWPPLRTSWHELTQPREERQKRHTILESKDGASSEVALCEPKSSSS